MSIHSPRTVNAEAQTPEKDRLKNGGVIVVAADVVGCCGADGDSCGVIVVRVVGVCLLLLLCSLLVLVSQ